MSSIVKRPNGRWQATYKGPDRRERSRSFDRKIDADNWIKTQGADVVRGQWADPQLGKITFGEWATKWQATTVHLRPTTRARDASYLKTHVLPRFGRVPLAAISHTDVRTWVADLVAAGKAPATVGKAFQIGGKVMRSAVEAGMIPSSPFANVKAPKIEREERRFLSPIEIAHLADAIDPRYRVLVLIGGYGGLRIGELAGLRRSRVDLVRGTIDVAEIVVEVSGHLSFGPPKTRAGRRTVSLPRPVVEELAAHLAASDGEFVFPSPLGGALRVPAFRRRVWAPAVIAAGLEGVTPHALPHAAVAIWIAAGASPTEIAARAGHTSVVTVLDRYGHLLKRHDERLRDELDTMYVAPIAAPKATISPLRKALG